MAYFYLVTGAIFLFVPLIYLELGRPKDLIKAFLNLIIFLFLIIKSKIIDDSFSVIFFSITVLVFLYLLELFSYRWNQLTDKEKTKLTTFLEFKNNLAKILEAAKIGFRNSTRPLNFLNFDIKNTQLNPKKWVRNDKNDNIKV